MEEPKDYGYHGKQAGLIAFQGEPGAYSEQAALNYFGRKASTKPCASFEDIFKAVQNEECQFGLLPMENSTAGAINKAYDLLNEFDLRIHGEVRLRVRHCLLTLPG